MPAAIAALCLLAAWLAAPAPAASEDAFAEALRRSDFLAAEIDAALRELDARQAEPFTAPPLPYHTLSINRNAVVTIGGEVRVNYSYSNGDTPAPAAPAADPFRAGRRGRFAVGDMGVSTTRLTVDVEMGDRWRAFLDVDLQGRGRHRRERSRYENDGAGGHRRHRDNNNLSQAYLELMKAGHSGFGVKAGQFYLPFGLAAKPDLFAQSYLAAQDLSGSYLMHPYGMDGMAALPHAAGFLDPVMAALISYELRDIVRFEAAVFQERGLGGGHRGMRDGRTLRSEQPLPRSFQLGMGIYPLEGWELSMAFRNRHSRSRGVQAWTDSPFRGDFAAGLASGRRDPRWDTASGQWSDRGDGPDFGSRKNEQSFTVGLALEIPNTALAVYGEYAYGWNQGFNKHIRSDNVNLGMAYRLTPRLTLHAQGEWLHSRDASWLSVVGGAAGRDVRNHHLYRTLFGAEYEVMPGLTLEGGWQYEYWRMNSATGAGDGGKLTRNWHASMFYMGTRFVF